MKTFKTLLIPSVLALILVFVGGIGFVYSGVFHIAADQPHWPITHYLITILRDRAIATHAQGIEVPPNLGDPERARRGAGNFDAMCVGCHLAPGLEDSEIRKGLYPQPPNLALPADSGGAATPSAARQFWVIKHGLKMSGMPAWGKGGMDDATIWDMVALLPKLSSLSAGEYRDLVTSSDGHSHTGAHQDGHTQHDAPADAAPDGHVDAPDAPPHSHGEAKGPAPADAAPAEHTDAPGTPPHSHTQTRNTSDNHEDDAHAH